MEQHLDTLKQKLEAVFELPISFEQKGTRVNILAKEHDPRGIFIYGYVDVHESQWNGRWSRHIEVYGKLEIDRKFWNMQLDFAIRFERFMKRLQHLPVDQRLKLLAERLP